MGTVKALIGFLAIVGLIYCGFQIIPPELSNYSFQDDLHQIAMMAGANPRLTDQDLIDTIVKKAAEHSLKMFNYRGNRNILDFPSLAQNDFHGTFGNLLSDGDSKRDTDQVCILKLHSRSLIAIVENNVEASTFQPLGNVF